MQTWKWKRTDNQILAFYCQIVLTHFGIQLCIKLNLEFYRSGFWCPKDFYLLTTPLCEVHFSQSLSHLLLLSKHNWWSKSHCISSMQSLRLLLDCVKWDSNKSRFLFRKRLVVTLVDDFFDLFFLRFFVMVFSGAFFLTALLG